MAPPDLAAKLPSTWYKSRYLVAPVRCRMRASVPPAIMNLGVRSQRNACTSPAPFVNPAISAGVGPPRAAPSNLSNSARRSSDAEAPP